MHNPIGLGAFGGFADIENQSFFYSNFSTFSGDDLISAGGFPVPRPGYPVGS